MHEAGRANAKTKSVVSQQPELYRKMQEFTVLTFVTVRSIRTSGITRRSERFASGIPSQLIREQPHS